MRDVVEAMDACVEHSERLSKRRDLCFWCGEKSQNLKIRSAISCMQSKEVSLCEICFDLDIDDH
jgi:hypothetical protein